MLEMICEELGVELGEEWLGNDGFGYIIKSDGDITIRDTDDVYKKVIPGGIYESIIKGKLIPVWKPDFGDEYFYPGIDFIDANARYNTTTWTEHPKDIWRFNNGLVFKTKEEAIEATNRMIELYKEDK